MLINPEDKSDKKLAKQITNAIMGYKAQFETILGKEIARSDKSTWEFKLSDADADDKLDALLPNLDQNEQTILAEIKNLFSAITLSSIVAEGKSLSQSMVLKYNQHKEDYHLLKSVIASQTDQTKAQKLRLAYDLYVNYRHGHLLEAKKDLKQKGVLTKEDFYKIVLANIDDSPASAKIKQEIASDIFMPKQRTSSNGVIPYQLHQIELDQIIAKQGKYYPFLAEENPVKQHRSQAPYKLDELVRFRVPYYVGPMITKEKQKASSGKSFAWMVRKDDGNAQITPWNFEETVDRESSANRFIKRMTLKDTYLLGEDVLPLNSLLYQKFEVLNELNNIKVNGKRLSPELKQDIYTDLFKTRKTVTLKNLVTYLKENNHSKFVEVKGLADSEKFNSSLSSYYHLKNLKVFDDQLDNAEYYQDIEQIIEWATIFEDKKIFQEKLREIKWLTQKQFTAISVWRLQGWGRLSRKLLVGLHNQNGQKNIMEQLWDSQLNFMQIVSQADFQAEIAKENQDIAQENGVEGILADAYTSPANKKAIRQVVKVVDDVVKAAGGKAPAQFAIEFTREPETNAKLSQTRGNKLLKVYKKIASELVDESLTNNLKNASAKRKLAKDKYVLYFTQGGRDAYTGKKINIDDVDKYYEIDHILPQAFIKDDSFDNRVLTAKPINAQKADDVPYKHFANNRVPDLNMSIPEMWKQWKKLGLISKYKLDNLLLNVDKLNPYQRSGFIKRQLVETSQIIKLVSVILQNKYPDSEIITVKSSYNTALRKRLGLYKSREVNDYHHALDAYLSIVCGNFLYQVYPKMRPYFVYGQFKKFSKDLDKEKNIVEQIKMFNFIWQLLQRNNPERKAPEKIHQAQDGPLVFVKHPDIFDKLRKAYDYKYMLVARETTTQDQEMFKMTIFPRDERDTKQRSLIPKNKGLDPAIYGGYSSNSDAYMAIVKIKKNKETIYRVVGVPMRALATLKQAAKQGKYDETLKQVLEPIVMFDKHGKPKRGLQGFEIIKNRLLYKQLVVDGERKFLLSSASYICNGKQLTLPKETMRAVTDNFEKGEDIDQALSQAYDDILSRVDRYLPLFDKNNFRAGLHKAREKFMELSIGQKKEYLKRILNGLHDNLVFGDLKELGIKTPFGQIQDKVGTVLSPTAKLIFQSPTGLFTKQVRIMDL